MSSILISSTNGSPTNQVVLWSAVGSWIATGGAAAAASVASATGAGRTVLLVAATLAVVSLIVGIALGRRTGRIEWPAVGLILSAVLMPTTFAYPLNLIPLLAGIALLFRSHRAALGSDQS